MTTLFGLIRRFTCIIKTNLYKWNMYVFDNENKAYNIYAQNKSKTRKEDNDDENVGPTLK